jgi:putative Mg2+ transporter-C (MgtC) family protein
MTGIGFIGGGAILKQGANVRGTATASSIWLTGALGAAIGYSEIEIAVVLSVLNYLVLRVLTPLGRSPDQGSSDDPEVQ